MCHLGDNCIQNFHLGRFIVGYTVRNLVLWQRVSRAVKRDFQMYIRRYTSPNENFEYGYPHSNAILTFSLKKDSENVLCCSKLWVRKNLQFYADFLCLSKPMHTHKNSFLTLVLSFFENSVDLDQLASDETS